MKRITQTRSRVAAVSFVLVLSSLLSAPGFAACTGDSINLTQPKLTVDVGDSSDCAAHEFSWNSFLALTAPDAPASKQPLFQTYMPISSLFVADDETPANWGDLPSISRLGPIFKEAGVELELLDTAGEKVLFDISANEVAYKYLLDNKLYNQQCFLNHDIAFPFGSATSGPGSILLKTSWRIYDQGKCPDSMICQNVEVAEEGSAAVVNRSAGLLGMHVVQKTPTHQEWIWSSFEHIAVAPDCEPGYSNPISNDLDWHLFKKSSPDQTSCNIDSDSQSACNSVNGESTNICRVSAIPEGALDNCELEDPDSTQALACLNASIQQRLPEGSAIKNYRLVGSLRMEPGFSAANEFANQAGSLALVNTSMESFVQGPDDLFNCFGCHAQSSGDFSHVFFRIKQVQPLSGCPLVE